MRSLEIAHQIVNLLMLQKNIFEPQQKEIARMQRDNEDGWVILDEEYTERFETSNKKIRNKITALYESSLHDGFYFFDCPLQTYKNVYTFRLDLFLNEFIDGDEKDFILNELRILSDPANNRLMKSLKYKCNYNEVVKNIEKYKLTNRKKKQYLIKKAEDLGFQITERSNALFGDAYFDAFKIDKFQIEKIDNTIEKEDPEITNENDEKSKKQLTANQAVLLLSQIGFFSHPKIENSPKTKQAWLISKLTGLNEKNLKKHIQKLEQNPNKLGDSHEKDTNKIDNILNSLE
jgi:hypothetical protein